MASDESLYKRDEDREWRKEVDRDRAWQTTAINVLQEQLKNLKKTVQEHQYTLRGEKGEPGLVAEYSKHDGQLIKLNSVVFQDSTGKHGLVHEVSELKSGEQGKERRWKYLTPIFIALVSLAGSLILGWDRISAFFKSQQRPPDELHQMMERAKRPRKRTVKVRYRVVPAPAKPPVEEDKNDEPGEVLPERRSGDAGHVE